MSCDLKFLFQVSEVEINCKNKTPYHERISGNTPWYAYDIFKSTWDMGKIELLARRPRNRFNIMLLDHKSNCSGLSQISTDGLNCCFVDPRLVFTTTLKSKATKLIFAHNRPSSMLKLSEPDIVMTNCMVEGGSFWILR